MSSALLRPSPGTNPSSSRFNKLMNGGDEVLVVTVRTAGTCAVEEYNMGSGSGEGQTAVAGLVVAIVEANRSASTLRRANGRFLKLGHAAVPGT